MSVAKSIIGTKELEPGSLSCRAKCAMYDVELARNLSQRNFIGDLGLPDG